MPTIININGQEHRIPATWNDLTPRQILLCYTALMDNRIDIAFDDLEALQLRRQEVTRLLLGLTPEFIGIWQEDAKDDFYDEFYQVCKAASEFAFEEALEIPGSYRISTTLTKAPIRMIPIKGENYFSPADELDNITLYELGKSFMIFEDYMREEKEEYAAELVAILFRPSKPATEHNIRSAYEGDQRLPLYKFEATIPQRKELIKKYVPRIVQQVIVFWFACCRLQIIKSFPNIFEPDKNVQADEDKNDYSWAGVILSLAGGIVHEETVSNQNFGTALTYLSMLEDQRKEQERKRLYQRSA